VATGESGTAAVDERATGGDCACDDADTACSEHASGLSAYANGWDAAAAALKGVRR
jgi:hypothetical protein